MVLYDITIFTYRTDSYISGNPRMVDIYVSKDEQYDKLSRRINRYRHTIRYTENSYNASNYHINVYDKTALYYKYLLKYFFPKNKVKSIDLFFTSSDYKKYHPLVLGINQENEDPIYYTYRFLIYDTAPKLFYNADFTRLPDTSKSFKEEDLITMLMEEHDVYLQKSGGDRMVIRLDAKPSNEGTSSTYPNTGGNKGRIVLSKSTSAMEKYFDKYEHRIGTRISQSRYYLCYNKDTLFIIHNNGFKDIVSVDVYYNKYYGQEPIIIILKSKDKNKLYKYLDLKNDFSKSNQNKMTSQLEDIEENSVENKLREENDNIYPYLPYLIDLKNDYSYKVNVEQKKDESNLGNFTKYSHTPQSGYSGKNSLVLYNGEKLMEKNNNKLEQIQEIQNVVYKAVNVYFGTKNQTIPLIIQLNKSEVSNNSKYYVHKKDDTSYWEKWEFQSTDDNKELLKKLKETESNLFDSISLLIDYDKAYTKDELEKIPGVKVSGSQPEKIDVSEYMNLECLNKSNYKCYKHCLTCKTNLDSSDIENVKLKLFIATETNRYSEISLHSSDDANDFNREHIYYEKGKTLNDFENNLYVIFYYEQNKKGDPRPVLFSYQKKVYRPLNLNEYSRKWVCVENSDFNPDICTDFNLLKILKGVSYFMNPVNIDEATGRKIGDYGITDRYITHRFNNSTTVQITIKPDDLNCYRKYTHSTTFGYILGEVNHNGSKLFESYEKYNSSLSTNRVGNFPSMVYVYYYLYDKGHDYPLLVGLSYGVFINYFKLNRKDRPLSWVRISDSHELELINKNIGKLLYNIRYDLQIDYENKNDNLIIESADKCNERNNVGVIVGVLSIIGVVAGGVAGAVYKFPEFFRSIYRRIN